jgi:pimeloyl-ACP methyl ester carboxylesterase
VLAIHYDGKLGKKATRFDWRQVVMVTEQEIVKATQHKHYDDIVFIGTSMGGKLAFLVARWLIRCDIRTRAILVDAPLSRRDFQFPLNLFSPLLRVLPNVPILNLIYVIPFLGGQIVKRVFVVPPKKEQIENLTLAERFSLDSTVEEARKTRISFHRDQVLSILKPLDAKLESPWGPNDVVYIRSDEDTDTVRGSAMYSWVTQLGFAKAKDLKVLILPHAQHCSYGQKPSRYRKALPMAFDYLGLK